MAACAWQARTSGLFCVAVCAGRLVTCMRSCSDVGACDMVNSSAQLLCIIYCVINMQCAAASVLVNGTCYCANGYAGPTCSEQSPLAYLLVAHTIAAWWLLACCYT